MVTLKWKSLSQAMFNTVLKCSYTRVTASHHNYSTPTSMIINTFMKIYCVCGKVKQWFSCILKEMDSLFSVGLTKPTEIWNSFLLVVVWQLYTMTLIIPVRHYYCYHYYCYYSWLRLAHESRLFHKSQSLMSSHFPAHRAHRVYKAWMTMQQSSLCENAHVMRVNGALERCFFFCYCYRFLFCFNKTWKYDSQCHMRSTWTLVVRVQVYSHIILNVSHHVSFSLSHVDCIQIFSEVQPL